MQNRTSKANVRRRLLQGAALAMLLTQSAITAAGQTAPAATPTNDPAAPAKEAPAAEPIVKLDEYRVTAGFASSLTVAATAKAEAPTITEVVIAEDIGKLPDISIADSLARLPGLATQRLNGRSEVINIRGLPGDFSTALFNGREQVSSGSNRSVEFDQYPAELLSGAVVYKTADASLIGQGLSGTVDMRTVRPLSQGKRTIAFNALYERTQFEPLVAGTERDGKRASISYIDQFMDGKLGVAVGFAHADDPGQGKQWNAWGYPNVDASVATGAPYVLGGAKPFVRSSQMKRNGFMGVVEFKPNSFFHTTFDLFRSKFKEDQSLKGIEIPLQWSSATLQPGFTVDRGVITKATYGNVFGVARNDGVFRNNDIWALGWNLKFGDGTGWTTVADLSYSRIYRKDIVLETYSGYGANQAGTADRLTYQLQGSTGAIFTPTLDYTNATLMKLSSPQGWGGDVVSGGQVGYLKYIPTTDSLAAAKISTKHDLNFIFSSFEVGAHVNRRTKSEIEDGYYLALPNGAATAPLPTLTGITDLSFIGIKGLASYDPIQALSSGTYRAIKNPNADVISAAWNVKEEISLAFLQLNINRKLGSLPLTGNLGGQVVNTDQSSTGLSAIPINGATRTVPTTGGKKYTNFLPSLNLTLKVTPKTQVRMSLARQLARQRMADMAAGMNVGYNAALANSTDPYNSAFSASGGNPELRPWESNSFDLSLEHYFHDNKGYVALAGFYKDLRTYTYSQKTIADFSGYPTTGGTPATFLGAVNRPANGQGGSIKGLETSVQLPSELLLPAVRGFGVVLGGAYTESAIAPYGPGSQNTPIPGFSRKVGTATLYYERNGFSARVSTRYRSKFRANIYTFGPRGDNFQTVMAQKLIDAQVSYAFQKGSLKGLTFVIQAYNLNNEPEVTYQNEDSRLVTNYQKYGAWYSAGVSYKF
ncbi:TonB-dependent receptor [Opitutus sp. ER46]|uniref:TonB-dependent receptor n=1 Tax=Opitutus sp. ER46 TaxID=2161864 RepID=UPI001E5ACE5E|nr:TonB-dependent receptor [Opitutus sp. ER46]